MDKKLSLLLILILAVSCTGIKRYAIKKEIKKAFDSTMQRGSELTQVAEGLYSFRWLSYRTAFLTTDQGVIVFDPINNDAAAELMRHIGKVAKNPKILYVIYSHGHRDHVSGASLLKDSPIILSSDGTKKDLEQRRFKDVLLPTTSFKGRRHSLRIGDVNLELIRLKHAHTDGDTLVYIPHLKVLYAVDLIWPGQLPPNAAPMSFFGVKKAVAEMISLDFKVFIAGHGRLGTREDVVSYGQFLNDIEKEFSASLKARNMDDFHSQDTFLKGPDSLGEIFFEVEDKLRPKYGHYENFDTGMISALQWCFWSVLIGD